MGKMYDALILLFKYTRCNKAFIMLGLVLSLGSFTLKAWSQFSITSIGTAYTENFDALPSTGAGLTQTGGIFLNGWSFLESGSNSNTTFDVGNGSLSTGNTYSFGTTSASDRAFGMLQSGSLSSILGFKFTNNTGSTITTLAIGYTGEVWRLSAAADNLAFSFQVGDVSLSSGAGWTNVTALNFTTPVTGTAAPVDGNASTNQLVLAPVNISGLNIANGATVTIRWVDATASSSAGLGIDNFSVNATAACTPPSITGNPSNQSVCTNTPANFTAASSTSGATFQWEMSANGSTGWTNVLSGTPTGATYTNSATPTLSVTSTTAITQYFYRCRVTAAGCDDYTSPAQLVVSTPPSITPQPASPAPSCASFSGTLTSTSIGTLQWQYSTDGTSGWTSVSNGTPAGSVYTNAATQLLTISGLTQTGYYRLLASSGNCPSITSNVATVTVNLVPVTPSGTISPSSSCGPTSLNYSTPSSSIYWQTSTNGTSTTNPTIAALPVTTTATYYVRAFNGNCWSSGELSQGVTIASTIAIDSNYPASVSVFSPNAANISIAGGHTGTVTSYLWEVSDDNGYTWIQANASPTYSNSTTATLTVSNSSGLTGNLYRCTVTGPCGRVVSNSATLTVNTPAYIWTNPITGTDPGLTAGNYITGDVFASNLSVSGISKGSGINGNAGTNRYNANNWNNVSVDFNRYFNFTLTPNATYKINFVSLVYSSQVSLSGPINFAVRSSIDN